MRLAQPKTRYFTVSEVGDKAPDNRTGTNWALVDDGMGGYDVVDVSGKLYGLIPERYPMTITNSYDNRYSKK